MAAILGFNSISFSCKSCRTRKSHSLLCLQVLSLCYLSTKPTFFSASKISTPSWKLGGAVSAVVSQESVTGSSSSSAEVFRLTYLEGNSWLWEVGGLKILVDPILVGNLDFGIPWLYDAAKKFLKNLQTTYLEPGQSPVTEASNSSKVKVRATAGLVLGPPWQRPENGYLVTSQQDQLTLYYEPHCVYIKSFLEKERAEIIITPVIKQLLPNFTLVSGQEDAVQLAKLLNAKFIVPMKNGDPDSKGILASLIQAEGTIGSSKEILATELPDARVLEPAVAVPLEIQAS